MDDGPDSIIRRYLRRIDERREGVGVRLDQLTNRARGAEGTTAALAHGVAAMSGRLDDVDARLARIARRLDLVEV